MKIALDETKCLKEKLTLQEALITLAVSMGNYKAAIDNLINRSIISPDATDVIPEWKNTITKLAGSTDDDYLSDERLIPLALKVQNCFPIQKMIYPGGQVSPFYFRCNKTEVKNKLKKFLTVYGNVSDEDIIDATKRYVASYAPKGYMGMRLVKYFIIKDDRKLSADDEVHVEQLSDLATFLENKTEESADDIVNGDDWLMNSRN